MSMINFKKLTNIPYLILISAISFYINWKYSAYGVYPIDTFFHYDSAYRILNGEYPIKDYWVVSGVVVDFLQAFFFKILNVSWNSYIFHASILNSMFSILTFYFLININLKKEIAFFYTISFSILAYPVSGTPFVDLHAAFFCVAATYFSISAIKNPTNYLNWFLVVSFYILAFFSKIVPTAYFLILNCFAISWYLLIKKEFKPFIIIFFSLLFYLFLLFLLLKFLNLEIDSLYIQLIDYPLSIGSDRLNPFLFSLATFTSNYKFILIPISFLSYLIIRDITKSRIKFSSNEFAKFLIFFNLCVSLILHQVLTKNQIYIYFLVPLSFGLLHAKIEKINFKSRNIINYSIMFLVIFVTIKYHIRYNENRKFHELIYTDISEHTESAPLGKSLEGIMWISPLYKKSPQNEINMLKQVKSQLNKKKNLMLISNYLFLDSITIPNLNSPNRAYTYDGSTMPLKKNKYFNYYKNYLFKKLIKKKINEVYFIKEEKFNFEIFTQFLTKDCYLKYEDDLFVIFKLNKKCII